MFSVYVGEINSIEINISILHFLPSTNACNILKYILPKFIKLFKIEYKW